jgi:hypothetical protein
MLTSKLFDTDVTVVSIGTNATAVAALERRKVDAIVTEMEYLMLGKQGCSPDRARGRARPPCAEADFCRRGLSRQCSDGPGFVAATEAGAGANSRPCDPPSRTVDAGTNARGCAGQCSATRSRRLDVDLKPAATVIPIFSSTGAMFPEAAEAVKNMLAVSVEKVRTGKFDLNKTWMNEYLAPL